MTPSLLHGLGSVLVPVLVLAAAVTVWGLLMVRRQKDKAELGITDGDGCQSCKAKSCASREPDPKTDPED
ncbi:MAG: hypothetical protein GXP62_11895 [Oligoflexia bacterium]|nr:hypothetical protein [Oligoflexia bacterium]